MPPWATRGIVSLSLGLEAVYLLGGESKAHEPLAMRLRVMDLQCAHTPTSTLRGEGVPSVLLNTDGHSIFTSDAHKCLSWTPASSRVTDRPTFDSDFDGATWTRKAPEWDGLGWGRVDEDDAPFELGGEEDDGDAPAWSYVRGAPSLPELRRLRGGGTADVMFQRDEENYEVVATWRHVVFIGAHGVHVLDWLPRHMW